MRRDDILDREATVNGIRIHYKIAGGGSPLAWRPGSGFHRPRSKEYSRVIGTSASMLIRECLSY
jgi:hypothetical protein